VEYGEPLSVYTQRCLGCHDAMQLRSGKAWGKEGQEVSFIMHGEGLGRTDVKAGLMWNLVYDFRRGIGEWKRG